MTSDEQFEAFLRRFRPLAPAPLPPPRALRWRPLALFAAAALVALAAGMWVWRGSGPHSGAAVTRKAGTGPRAG
jgi:hypothetical protein